MRGQSGQDIAIIGMAGRFPGARNIDEFWQNLENGRESISFFSETELLEEGINPHMLKDPNYVKARSILEDIEFFDAEFFGINPREAETMDPQHRIFLETAWEAMENAGYDPDRYPGSIGVYAGACLNTYLLHNLCSDPAFITEFLSFTKVGTFQTFLGSDKDHLSTRVAYKMNLKGPAITMQTACSTSLVSLCQAVANLVSFQCDIALVGGVTVTSPKKKGYLYDEGGMVSPDGHCRAFDAKAQGTVFGSGVGVVVLKRMEEAIKENDNILAVIKGAALNNDGSQKVSYTAPSVDGQAEAIMLAHALAGISAETITYVEAHGTGTPLGDPIEIAALTQAFRATTNRRNFCAIGSVKTNIGHLDVASGIAGVIKTVLALKNNKIPPTLHFEQPNPKIDFANSPFFVNTRLEEWKTKDVPRRAGVSSFGVGGTNAHIVLEEAPPVEPSTDGRAKQLVLVSAKSDKALKQRTNDLAKFLKANAGVSLHDVAYTLQVGRKKFDRRSMLVARDRGEAIELLESGRTISGDEKSGSCSVVFMFPGQGAQYVNMGRGLYAAEKTFRETVDECAELLHPLVEFDIRDTLFPTPERAKQAQELLVTARIAQPAIFTIEMALARLWISWGIEPAAMIGHSVGEYVAACVSGVFDLRDALFLVANRARLVQEQPGGAMLAVRLSATELRNLLPKDVQIAACNSPLLTIAAGPAEGIHMLECKLQDQGVASVRLQTSHAFHSSMMEPVIPGIKELVGRVTLRDPLIPFVSTVTGRWISPAEVKSPEYWASHLRQPVRFSEAIELVSKDNSECLLEVGPGRALCTFARQHPGKNKQNVIGSLSVNPATGDDCEAMLNALGRLWLAGAEPDWETFNKDQKRRRVALPTYPFERKRYWVEPQKGSNSQISSLREVSVLTGVDGEIGPAVIIQTEAKKPLGLIANGLRSMLQEMSGVEMSERDDDVTFAEKGFDSLFLTQIRVTFEKKFGVNLTPRQLREDLSTVSALARFIEQNQTKDAATITYPSVRLLGVSDPTQKKGQTSIVQELADLRQEIASLRQLFLNQNNIDEPSPLDSALANVHNGKESHTAVDRRKFETIFRPDQADSKNTFPLTYAQRELWIVSQADVKASCAYNESEIIELGGAVNIDALQESVHELVARHESLRTRFSPDGATQSVVAFIPFEIPVSDFSGLNDAERTGRVATLLESEGEIPIDFINGSPVRAQIVKISDQRFFLIFTAHHIVCDGWAMSILLQELAEIYSAKVQHRSFRLDAPFQFSEFVRRMGDKESEARKSEKYWVEKFAGDIPILQLPADFPRNSARTFKGERVEESLDLELLAQVRRAAAQRRCTPYVYFLSVFEILLSRWTRQPDVVVGMPVSGQTIIGEERLVGHCINVLPLRMNVEPSTTFGRLIDEVSVCVSEALDHSNFTFSQLIEKLNVPRDSSRVPIVQATFNLNRPFSGLRFDSLEAQVTALPQRRHNFDISLHLVEINGGMLVQCRYNADAFSKSSIQQLVRSYLVLLQNCVGNEDQPVANINMLAPNEIELVTRKWNETSTAYPQKCIHELFEEQAAHSPDAVAVSFNGGWMSYGELNEASNQLARHLRKLGVKANQPVGFCVERSLEMIISLLAILKAGGAYLALDPGAPAERLVQMLRDAGAKVFVTTTQFKNLVPVGVRMVCLDEDASKFIGEEATNLPCETTPDDLAYVAFTSGSTGVPKGVSVLHRGVVRLVRNTNYVEISGEDVFLQFAPIAFDASTFEIWGALLNGARVVEFPRKFESLNQLAETILKERISILWLTAGLFHQMIADGYSKYLRNVKQLLAGGDVLAPAAVAEALRELPNTTLINGYGPTENTTFTCCYKIPADYKGDHPVPIGRPISNTRVYILDQNLQPTPPGVPGELFIGGDGLSSGYVNSPELTAQKFVSDPFGVAQGARLYRSGDLVKWLPSGDIEFIGRIDSQVKIRGFRVELGEIENAIDRQAGVRHSVVVLRKDDAGDSYLVSYVVADNERDSEGLKNELKSALKRTVPDYMVPRAYVFLKELPLNRNGKVDVAALPPPVFENEDLIAPRTPTEEFLVDIWQQVIGRDKIGVFDNFFDLGGHSLMMTQIVSRIRATLQIDLPIGAIFNTPTIAALAEILDQKLIDDINAEKRGELASA